MLLQTKEFKNFKLRAKDGDIGKAIEFFFDDKHWTVRYLVADTGGWLFGRQVLISPYALGPVDESQRVFPVKLTKKQIEESPLLESNKPVSRQFENEFYDYYGWPAYWYGSYSWGVNPYMLSDQKLPDETIRHEKAWDPNLRSMNEVTGYHIQATDGTIGHVAGFIIDENTWTIRYMIVDTGNWWVEHQVLISPQWIDRISWDESKVFLAMSRDTIKQAPEYMEESLTRDYETDLHKHYDRQGYWTEEPPTKENKTVL